MKIAEVMSQRSDVLSGIPQGSILGPIFFIINDLIELCGDDVKAYLLQMIWRGYTTTILRVEMMQ